MRNGDTALYFSLIIKLNWIKLRFEGGNLDCEKSHEVCAKHPQKHAPNFSDCGIHLTFKDLVFSHFKMMLDLKASSSKVDLQRPATTAYPSMFAYFTLIKRHQLLF